MGHVLDALSVSPLRLSYDNSKKSLTTRFPPVFHRYCNLPINAATRNMPRRPAPQDFLLRSGIPSACILYHPLRRLSARSSSGFFQAVASFPRSHGNPSPASGFRRQIHAARKNSKKLDILAQNFFRIFNKKFLLLRAIRCFYPHQIPIQPESPRLKTILLFPPASSLSPGETARFLLEEHHSA